MVVVDDQHRRRGRLVLYTVACLFWTGSALTYAGRDVWLHLGLGVAYLVFTIGGWWQRSRVLATAARWGVVPRKRADR